MKDFNPASPSVMHIDLNSCFATIEQQANPGLRGRPIAVAAYSSPAGCILAPSIEAKMLGIKTGMRVGDARPLCPNLIVLTPDPNKYRFVHLALRKIISRYTADYSPKSIDEFVLNLAGYPAYRLGMGNVAREIKTRIRSEIGEWLTVSVGIGPNRFLAKTAAGLHKPDGLDEINNDNFLDIYSQLKLTDLCGIKTANSVRLNLVGVYSVVDFYRAPIWKLKAAFESIGGYYWWCRLHGWEVDNIDFGRRSFGNSYAFPKPLTPLQALPILQKLCTKTGFRLRRRGYRAGGVYLAISYRDRTFSHKGQKLPNEIFDSRDIYRNALAMALSFPQKPVRVMAVSVFGLVRQNHLQYELFEETAKKAKLVRAVDKVNSRWGDFVVAPARVLAASDAVGDRISFGGVAELDPLL